MTIALTITEVRKTNTVPFYSPSPDYITYIQKYRNVRTGNGGKFNISEDQLTRTHSIYYSTMEDYTTISTDPVIVTAKQERSAYNTANNITSTETLI
jgi:hypothetical protein